MQANQTCITRQQALRYVVTPSSTFPEIPKPNMLNIDSESATLYFENFDLSNYEALLLPGANMQCDLGPPVRSGDGSLEMRTSGWVAFRTASKASAACGTTRRRNGLEKNQLSYLDAAALCAGVDHDCPR